MSCRFSRTTIDFTTRRTVNRTFLVAVIGLTELQQKNHTENNETNRHTFSRVSYVFNEHFSKKKTDIPDYTRNSFGKDDVKKKKYHTRTP